MKTNAVWLIGLGSLVVGAVGCVSAPARPGAQARLTQPNQPAAKGNNVSHKASKPVVDNRSPDQLIDDLNAHLTVRFAAISDDRFGEGGIPEQYHLHGGIMNPEGFSDAESEDNNLQPTPDNVPTAEETSLFQALTSKGFELEVYTFGSDDRFRGPVGDDDVEPSLLGDKFLDVARNVLNHKGPESASGSEGHVYFKAKAVKAPDTTCASCHAGVKAGDKVGTVIYRYWKQSEGGFSANELQKKADNSRNSA